MGHYYLGAHWSIQSSHRLSSKPLKKLCYFIRFCYRARFSCTLWAFECSFYEDAAQNYNNKEHEHQLQWSRTNCAFGQQILFLYWAMEKSEKKCSLKYTNSSGIHLCISSRSKNTKFASLVEKTRNIHSPHFDIFKTIKITSIYSFRIRNFMNSVFQSSMDVWCVHQTVWGWRKIADKNFPW